MQVHQFYPTVAYGDAASNHVLSLQRMLRRMDYGGEIFCERLPLLFEGRARQVSRYAQYSSPDNVLLLHYSMAYTEEVLSWLRQLPDRKVLVYHNITPHAYFAGIDMRYYEAAREGREQLAAMRVLTEAGWGDSAYNCRELTEHGWSDPGVLPLVFEPRRYAVGPDREVLKRWGQGANILFVGRAAPSKRLEDLILTFSYVKRRLCQDANLLLVGSTQRMEPYVGFLRALVARLALPDVVLTGHVSTSELVAYYQCASVYVSMSEHEGFCMPLVESMHFGVPIIAYRAAAVPETLGDSGILVSDKDPAGVAELVGLLLDDDALRERIVERQRERAADFYPGEVEKRLGRLLGNLGN